MSHGKVGIRAVTQNIVKFCIKSGEEESSGVQAGAWGCSWYMEGSAGVLDHSTRMSPIYMGRVGWVCIRKQGDFPKATVKIKRTTAN